MKRLYWMPVLALSMLLGACASTVKPAYVSPTQYQALNCQQLQAEYNRIQQYIENGVQPAKRTGVGVGVGLGGGWARGGGWGISLLGQQDAIVQAAQFKGCPMIIKQRPKS